MLSGSYDITVLSGETKNIDFTLYQDNAQTTPFDLTGCTVTVSLSPPNLIGAAPLVLAVGNGLTIADPTTGVVSMSEDTTGWQVGRGRWHLELVDSNGDSTFPIRGNLYVGNP